MPRYAVKFTGVRQLPANRILGNNTGSVGPAKALTAAEVTAMGVGGNPFDQDLNEADSPTFAAVNTGSAQIGTSGGGSKFNTKIGATIESQLTSTVFCVTSQHGLGFASSTYAEGANLDTALYRGGAGIFEQRNGANSQEYRLFNTYTNSTNYERGVLKWASNVLVVGTEADGTGTRREITLDPNSFVLVGSTISLFTDGSISQNLGTDDNGFFNFQATADGDTTSAISTLTTSGSVTHHIQIEINGVKAWIPVSTNAPS